VEKLSKPLILLLVLVLAVAVLASCGGDTATTEAPKAELTYAMSGLYKPFNFTKDGELVGFDVEIGQALAEQMGMTANPVTNPWETIIEGLKSKKYDVIIGSMAITETRLEQVSFTNPYYRSGAQIFVGADNTDINSPEDLAGKKIGVVKASTFKDIAVTLTDEDKVVGYDSDVIALQDLTTGRIDAVITDAVVGFSAIMENGLEIKDVAEPLYIDEMGITVRKEDTALLADLNAALDAIIADGTYDAISTKWLGRNILGE